MVPEKKFSEKHPPRTQTAWGPASRSSTRAKLLRDHAQPAFSRKKDLAGLNEPKHFLYPPDRENNFEGALDDLLN
jgi:hypothetical protein